MSSPKMFPLTFATSGFGFGYTSRSLNDTFRKNRSILLDCIRAVAVLAVVIFHVATRYEDQLLDPVAAALRRFGLLGVDVFFPLSGFLITRFLLKATTSERIGAFFMRRFFRIVPLYMVAVTLYLAASLLTGVEAEIADRIWIPYTFLTGWFIFFEGRETVPYTITWSLSVEEFAYIVFGLIAWICRARFVHFLIAISIASLSLRLYLELTHTPEVYHFPLARLDSIAMGGLAAILIDRRTRGLTPLLGVLTLAVYSLAVNVPELWTTLKYTFITLGTCFFISLFETELKTASAAPLQALASIGFYSYFIYLFHFFNIELALMLNDHFLPGERIPFWIMSALCIAATYVQAVASFHVFEGPIMKLGRSFESPRSDAGARKNVASAKETEGRTLENSRSGRHSGEDLTS